MRREFACALIVFLAAACAAAQQAAPSAANAQPAPTVYNAGPGVIAPTLLQPTPSIVSAHHCQKLDGAVVLSAVVGVDGLPSEVKIFGSYDADLEKMALSLVAAERFKPGTHNGLPAAVAVVTEVRLQTCAEPAPSSDGSQAKQVTLRARPQQSLAIRFAPDEANPAPGSTAAWSTNRGPGRVSAPVLLRHVQAQYSDRAREEKINGVCIISLIVDANGRPQDVHVVRSLEPGLDQNAMYAISQYRFKPAMKNGRPVPVIITIEVDFRLY